MQALLVLCTCPSEDSAEAIARALVEARLAACVNLLPGIRSIYRWQGAIQADAEILLLIKTRAARLEELKAAVLRLHPYELPEILAVEAGSGLEDYLAWIGRETTPPAN